MTFRWTFGVAAAALALTVSTPLLAGKLPAGAVPLVTDEVVKMHAGSTGQYPTTDEYFTPEGATMGVFGKPVAKSAFFGKWIANGNTLCTLNGSTYDAKIYTDCSAFWRAGDKTYVLWATHSDGSKPDALNGYYEVGLSLKPGNLIGDKYKALGGP